MRKLSKKDKAAAAKRKLDLKRKGKDKVEPGQPDKNLPPWLQNKKK